MEKEHYIEIAVGHPKNRGIIINTKHLSHKIDKSMSLFRSIYLYDNDINDHFKTRKTIKNFKGKRYLNKIIIDIDKNYDTDLACLARARYIYDQLTKKHKLNANYIIPSFSGTGYHLAIPDIFNLSPSHTLPQILKENMDYYFKDIDHIFDSGRIIRVAFTPNEKTGNERFKIPLTIDEFLLLDAEEIIELSKAPDMHRIPIKSIPTKLSLLENKANSMQTVAHPDHTQTLERAEKFSPSSVISCVQKMWHEGPIRGNRHRKLLRMVSVFRRNGLPQEAALFSSIQWADTLEEEEVKRIVSDVYEKGYQYSCRDNIMDQFCDKRCIHYPAKMRGEDPLRTVLTAQDMEQSFVNRIRSGISKNAIDLNQIINVHTPYIINPGELVVVQGPSGVNKTAFLQNIAIKYKMDTLWLSLEMSSELTYRRFIQIAHNKTKEEVINHYNKHDNGWGNAMSHIKLTAVAPKLQIIKRMIAENMPKVLIVDTMEDIIVDNFGSDLSRVDAIIKELRRIASLQDIIVMAVSHITKADSREGILDMYSAKGSATIPQKADKAIGIQGDPKQTRRIISNLKARDEDGFVVHAICDPATFRFSQDNPKQKGLNFKGKE